MQLLKNHYYKICFNVGDKLITFTCKIINDDGTFIEFEDKYKKTLTYNKSNIVSSEEVENDGR